MKNLNEHRRLYTGKILLMKIANSNYETDSGRRGESPSRRRPSVGFDVETSPRDSRRMRSIRPPTPSALTTPPRTPTRRGGRSRSSDFGTPDSPSRYRTPTKRRRRSHSVESPSSSGSSAYEMSPNTPFLEHSPSPSPSRGRGRGRVPAYFYGRGRVSSPRGRSANRSRGRSRSRSGARRRL